MGRGVRIGGVLLAGLAAIGSPAWADEVWRIPPGREPTILALVRPLELMGEAAPGWRLTGLRVDRSGFAYLFERRAGAGTEQAALAFRLEGPAGAEAPSLLLASVPPAALEHLARRVLEAATPEVLRAVAETEGGRDEPDGGDPGGEVSGTAEPRVRIARAERFLAGLAAVMAAATLGLLGAAAIRRRVRPARADVLACAGVLSWSLLVRFGLTEPNVLTDGDSGATRILGYLPGYGGTSVLLAALLPGASMAAAVGFTSLLSALSPPLLFGLARALDLPRPAAGLAGLGLASLPLHAAMYRSDFIDGAALTFALGAFVLAARPETPLRAAAALSLAVFTGFARPEALVVALPVLALAWGRWPPVSSWPLPLFLPVAGLAAVAVSARVFFLSELDLARGETQPFHAWFDVPWGEHLASQAVFPVWLWLPALWGLVAATPRVRRAVLAGGAAGLAVVTAGHGAGGADKTFELFRYATLGLPWLALASAIGIADVARRLPRPRLAVAAAAAVLAATPLAHASYLGRLYVNRVEEESFRRALSALPEACGLVLPDDDWLPDRGTNETLDRYVRIAREAARESGRAAPETVGLTAFLREGRREGAPCWAFFRGVPCAHRYDSGEPEPSCVEAGRALVLEPLWEETIPYRSHRLVALPDSEDPRWYDPALPVSLLRIAGDRP